MKGGTILLLGAGFSRPAGGPLLAELLSENVISANKLALSANLQMVSNEVAYRQRNIDAGYSIESFFSEVWRAANTAGVVRTHAGPLPAKDVLADLRTHLASVASQIKVRRRTILWNSYTQFFRVLPRKLAIISFNYDLLVEQILTDLGMQYSYNLPKTGAAPAYNRPGTSGTPLLKLHGSVNWLTCKGCPGGGSRRDNITLLDEAYVPLRRKRCEACRRMGDSAIIPPIEGKASEAAIFLPMWEKARKLVREAKAIIAIGYSLPKTDNEAVDLLKEAEHAARPPRGLVVCGGTGGAAYTELFPNIFTDTRLTFEEFSEHYLHKTQHGMDSYRAAFTNPVRALGAF